MACGPIIHGGTSGGQAEIAAACKERSLGKALAAVDRIGGAGGVLPGGDNGMTIPGIRVADPGEGFARLTGVSDTR